MNIIPTDLARMLSVLGGMLVLAACVLLWLRDKTSVWALLALVGQAVSMLCRLVLPVPDLWVHLPPLRLVWPVAEMMFAVGLIGYAWTEYDAAQRKTAGGKS